MHYKYFFLNLSQVLSATGTYLPRGQVPGINNRASMLDARYLSPWQMMDESDRHLFKYIQPLQINFKNY